MSLVEKIKQIIHEHVYACDNQARARFLHETDRMVRSFVYVGCGVSLQRRMYRKKEVAT